MSRPKIRRAFQQPTYFPAKVTPEGFFVDEELLDTLKGQAIKSHLLRKRFEDGELTCDSRDGVTSSDGTDCNACLHPQCRPILRLHLRCGCVVYVIDLAITSAQNFFRLEDVLEADGCRTECTTIKLSVVNRGYWGEVRFEPDQ